jgi:two-component system, LytTR family, response regulator
MKIKALIVDDEPLARERIRSMLRDAPDIEVAGECGNGPEAVRAVKELAPDLLFLDVQMPGMDGFEVLRSLGGPLPFVIFVTAYDRHALRAFEVHALDYLLKPFKPARFAETLCHAREALHARETRENSAALLKLMKTIQPAQEHLTRIVVKSGEKTVFVKADQVEYAEAAGNYVVLHVGKESHVLRETLGALEEKLDPRQFVRISRSALVNMDQIKEVQPMFKGEHAVVLRSGKQLPMTRGLREIQDLLKFS